MEVGVTEKWCKTDFTFFMYKTVDWLTRTNICFEESFGDEVAIRKESGEGKEQTFEQFFEGLYSTVQEFREAFNAGHVPKVLEAVRKLDINSHYYNCRQVYDMFREMGTLKDCLDSLDLHDDRTQIEGFTKAEIADDEGKITIRVMAFLLCLSQQSRNYTAVLFNFRFMDLVDKNALIWPPQALAFAFMIMSNMVLDATNKCIGDLIDTDRCAKVMHVAHESQSKLVLASAVRVVFSICAKGTPADIERRQGFYMSVYEGTVRLLEDAYAGQYDEKAATLVEIYHLLVILTEQSLEVSKRMACSSELDTIIHTFQSDDPILVGDCLRIILNILRHANSDEVTGQIASRIPWVRLSRMLSDDKLSWRQVYLDLVDQVTRNPSFFDRLFELEVYQYLIDAAIGMASLPMCSAIGSLFAALLKRISADHIMGLVSANLFDLIVDMFDFDNPHITAPLLESLDIALTTLERAGVDLQVIADELSKRDAVSSLKSIPECSEQAYAFCQRLHLA